MSVERSPLLLLPGSLCDARLFSHQVAALGGRRLQVGNIGGADTLTAIAADVLRQAPRRFALAGFSMGGIVAFEIWRQAPHRVAGLALLDTSFAAESPEAAARRSEEIRTVAQAGTAGLRRLVRDFYLPRYFAERQRCDQRLHDLVLQMATACGPRVLLRQWNALLHRPCSRATLATIDCPALVLCGAEDQLCPPSIHEEMAAEMGVQCSVLGDCGHLAPIESPAQTAAFLRAWLQRVDEHERCVRDELQDVAC